MVEKEGVLKGKLWGIKTLHRPEGSERGAMGCLREEQLGSGNSKCKG